MISKNKANRLSHSQSKITIWAAYNSDSQSLNMKTWFLSLEIFSIILNDITYILIVMKKKIPE